MYSLCSTVTEGVMWNIYTEDINKNYNKIKKLQFYKVKGSNFK